MFTQPEMMLLQATERRLELEEQARQDRLASALRRTRRAEQRAGTVRGRHRRHEAPARGQPAGTLTPWAASEV